MSKLKREIKLKTVLTIIAATALIAGCGGGGGGSGAQPTPEPVADIGQSVTATVDFVNRLINENGENSDPVAVTTLTLAVDDSAEPTALK